MKMLVLREGGWGVLKFRVCVCVCVCVCVFGGIKEIGEVK